MPAPDPVADLAPDIVWTAPADAPRAVLLLAHGAGGDHRAALLASLADALPGRGVAVGRFDYPYRRAGKKLPDPMPKLEAAHEVALAAVAARAPGVPLFLGGKSMGGRVASHLAARGAPCAGLVLLGYPLHPAGKPEKLRDAHLPSVQVPMLLVQGTRDALCDLDLLRPVLARCGDRARLHVIDDGDHSLEVRRASGRTNREVLAEVADVVARFVLPGEARRSAP